MARNKTNPKSTTSVESAIEGLAVANEKLVASLDSGINVDLGQKETNPTSDQAFWVALRKCLGARTFDEYSRFIDGVLCPENGSHADFRSERSRIGFTRPENDCRYRYGGQAYQMLRAATEVFVLCQSCCSILEIEDFDPEDEESRLGREASENEMQADLDQYLSPNVSPQTLPYLATIIKNLKLGPITSTSQLNYPFCEKSLRHQPCFYELIWSYWHEEGMLVQALNAISWRFQNRRLWADRPDPMSTFALDPLRPLNNFLWGYIQDTDMRLTVTRRMYEYEHEYGLQLFGKAIENRQIAERRSQFIEAFHNLLHVCDQFYRDDSNRWITPDPFPLLNALRAVHMELAQGAHNQFGDLPSVARQEMLIQQWLLAQSPMREFLQSRAMVPYDEPWMGQVDAMKKILGGTDVSVIHFHRLAKYAEAILLSIRYGNWNDSSVSPFQARNWAVYWKQEIMGYVEAYRVVTGVSLSSLPATVGAQKLDHTPPAVHLRNRLRQQREAASLPASDNAMAEPSFAERRTV